jgi:acyl-homoserine lactone acylase PvdQ
MADPEDSYLYDKIKHHNTDNFASNAWVIHGNHTESGKSILSGDPHLINELPSFWLLMELNWGDHY